MEMMMKKNLLSLSSAAMMLLGATQSAHAAVIVFDPNNFSQNVVTAAKSVANEINTATQTIYQNTMMVNQLRQAVALPSEAMQAQISLITNDINQQRNYLNNLTGLYGSLNNGQQWIVNVQGLISSSGKTPSQWITDQATLANHGSQQAQALFQNANNIAQHQQQLAQQRQSLQSQLQMTPTEQATATLTTHYLDVVASQNADLVALQTQAAQEAAQKKAEAAQQQNDMAQQQQAKINAQNAEYQALHAAGF